ncbi:DNA-directed RNA polymerase III subunit RPC4 [Culicoides brevitarsis]|uniref:DNA-directed RNA polymerase III subunit RPC4 n=1 Tax=Culicoides brevitarsis TaxID=469753 RepID=UPI00307B362C
MSSTRGGTTSGTIKVKNEMDLLRKDRLPSLKSRDLTLGGLASVNMKTTNTASTKREFKPNLNVQRNKNADVRPNLNNSTRGRGGGRGERGRGVDRGKRGHNSHLVQTQGLFSEGAGALNIKRQISRSYSTRESGASDTLTRPTLNKINVKVDPELESKQLRDILGDDDDDMEDDKSSASSDKVMPISLDSYKVKQEDIKTLSTKFSEQLETKSEESFGDFLQQQQASQLLLLQMPDALPATVSKDVPMEEDQMDGDSAENGFKKAPNNFCTLHDLPEGQIGKLVRYKSGKLKLVLGSGHSYDVTHGIDSTFLQEVVSITTNREERSGNIVNLGKVKGKLTVTPDWPQLFNEKS